MSGSIYPRANQIAELTRGIRLPTPRIGQLQLEVITEKVGDAWKHLTSTQNTTLTTGTEAEINALLQARLNRMTDFDQVWSQLVRCVVRGGETLSFDGAHLEKRPDLSIVLTRSEPSFPLVVECKLIDTPNGKTPLLYCNEGLRRFLLGEYGWANPEGLMLAYVRDSSTIAGSLGPLLSAKQQEEPDPYGTEQLPAAVGGGALDCAATVHSRCFAYPAEQVAGAPGSISILHLWLPT